MSTYVINHLRLPGGIPNEEDMGPEKFDDGSRVFASDTGWASAEVSDLGETRIAWFRRGGYVSFPDRSTVKGRLLRVRSGHAEVEVQ